jgi:hypothetical protein
MKNPIPAHAGIQSTPVILEIFRATECRILRRINRFVVEVQVRGRAYRAHITNTGRLEQFLISGKIAYCLPKENPGKTDFLLVKAKRAGVRLKAIQMVYEPADEVGEWGFTGGGLTNNSKLTGICLWRSAHQSITRDGSEGVLLLPV